MKPPIVTTKTITTPGRDIKLTLALQPQPPIPPLSTPPSVEPGDPPAVCIADIDGLFWLTDADGTFSETAEVAYLLPSPDQAAGPVLAVAGIIGETCGAVADWQTAWTPASGSGGDPGVVEDGNRLVIWPKADTEPGVLTVTGRIHGHRYGPISLTVLRYECTCYGSGSGATTGTDTFAFDPLRWNTGLVDEWRITGFGAPPSSYTATITGTWPPGTTFAWTTTTDGTIGGITYAAVALELTLDYAGGVQAQGTFTASVTATGPLGTTHTLGPITFTVTPY